MSVIDSPVDPRVQMLVDRSFAAGRFSTRPLDFLAPDAESQAGGHFGTKIATGSTTVLNAGDAIASLRWAPSASLDYVLLGLKVAATVLTAFGTAQEVALDLVKVSNFAAADAGAGSTTANMGAHGRRGRDMGSSQITELRAAGAVALTKASGSNEDTQPVGWSSFAIGNAVGSTAESDLFRVGPYSHPLVLAPGEGWRVRIGVTQGATGVVRFTLVPEWAEVPRF